MAELNYRNASNKPEAFLAMTGLTVSEFEIFYPYFLDEVLSEREVKQEAYHVPESAFRSERDMLFFILFYLKTYPLQHVLAFLFNMAQSTAANYVTRLSDTLVKALSKADVLPENIPEEVKKNWKKTRKTLTLLMQPKGRSRGPKTMQPRKNSTVERKKGIQ